MQLPEILRQRSPAIKLTIGYYLYAEEIAKFIKVKKFFFFSKFFGNNFPFVFRIIKRFCMKIGNY